MSEYQYYEFQAIDRPLTREQMAELRALSTRATISPNRFVNVYNWGDFQGNPRKLMESYFDAFVYIANWGTHWCMFRLPRRLLDPKVAQRYAVEDLFTVHTTDEHVILEFRTNDEEGGRWVDDEEGPEWMASLLPLRADLAQGDLRALYLAWLAGMQYEIIEDDEPSDDEMAADDELLEDEDEPLVDGDADDGDRLDHTMREPPVPPGLGQLSASLEAFARFLEVDEDLIAVAAERSADLDMAGPSSSELERWVARLPAADKDALLLRLAMGADPHLHAELLRRFRQETTPAAIVAEGSRTAAALVAAAKEHAEIRRREEAEREARERARRQREQAAARAAYLESLVGREAAIWGEVEALVAMKRAGEYDRAVQLLVDLRDLAALTQSTEAFNVRLRQFRADHPKQSALQGRLDHAGLRQG